MTRRALLAFACLFSFVPSGWTKTQDEIAVVLSSDLEPYEAAFAGFEEALGAKVPALRLDQGAVTLRGHQRIVVAFGGKAATYKYPADISLIYCMAPGTLVAPGQRPGTTVQVSVMPQAAVVLQKIADIQPAAKRLAMLWISPSSELYLPGLRKAARDAGIALRTEKLSRAEDLPAKLRELQGATDALWIPADPLLLNPQNLVLLSQFSTNAKIPFYSAIAGLAERGAIATISVDYVDVGREAARVLQSLLSGGAPPLEVYSAQAQTVINERTAAKAGVEVGTQALNAARRVIR
jgi:ABC-type uncharacterized transport system substrate-binding protein